MSRDERGDESFWAQQTRPRPSNVIPLRPARPDPGQADATRWADRIRARMGWHRGQDDEQTRIIDLRELAAQQVAESRAGREIRL